MVSGNGTSLNAGQTRTLPSHLRYAKLSADLPEPEKRTPSQLCAELKGTVQLPVALKRPQVIELLWSIASALLEQDSSFWIFWSDRAGARAVLEHLITRHPDTQRLADALRILGDMAFDAEDYEMAQIRYREIILERPDSDWRFYANFRFAMSIVAGLRGPDYDLDGMKVAATELLTCDAGARTQMAAEV